jgi:hypothetical protein
MKMARKLVLAMKTALDGYLYGFGLVVAFRVLFWRSRSSLLSVATRPIPPHSSPPSRRMMPNEVDRITKKTRRRTVTN